MNPFEKIFNHQIISRLEDSGMLMITSHERTWLKTMLEHPTAAEAFNEDTLDKLQLALDADQVMDISAHLIEKARTMEKQVYHPLLRLLRRHIMNKSGIRITYEIKGGRVNVDHSGFPYKLEYSMVKREWYLLWYHTRHRTLMSTRLTKIHSVTPESVEPLAAKDIIKRIEKILHSRKSEVTIEIIPAYNEELSRILYAFSSFEKSVEFTAENDTYQVKVSLLADETEYLLSKIRFLGKRIRIVEGEHLKKRMLESSAKALERYANTTEEESSMLR